ncbi:hypothetical protein [Parendozoicomonas haliclonae]|uniref:Uncharacterized protein n=1 Tax=Parendozoicomonas haliclonae TaxID=1960125 RepID=A0A1X7AGJ0_9GAMM|nr:hypothetical protein [Parendozoicomonas haliclonae]SMA38939.1 hypothetical protein EHSB41UT_00946 [Parendozoicomonas haliclonae]
MASRISIPQGVKRTFREREKAIPDQQDCLKKARVLPVYPDSGIRHWNLWPLFKKPEFSRQLTEAIVERLDASRVHAYFNNGGEIDHRDAAGNTPVHLLAIHHGHWQQDKAQLQNLETVASEMMSFYNPLEALEICQQRNNQQNTPWHELMKFGDPGKRRSQQNELSPAAKILIKVFLHAAASPLYAGKAKERDQCPAIALLPKLTDELELISLIVKYDQDLNLRFQPGANPAVQLRYPNLIVACIRLHYPAVLQQLLISGASWTETENHPAHIAMEDIRYWPQLHDPRQCARVLCDWAITLKGSELCFDLISVLNYWEKQRLSAGPEKIQALRECMELLLNMIERHNTAITCRSEDIQDGAYTISEGLQLLLQRRYTHLWSLYRKT